MERTSPAGGAGGTPAGTVSGGAISSVSVTVLRVPRPKPVRSAIGTYQHIHVVAVDLETSDGVAGHGYTLAIGGGALAMRSFIETEWVHLLKGRDPFEVKRIWWDLFHNSLSRGRKGLAMYALSAVDIALWDVIAKRAKLPLARLLGCYRDRVPAYGDGCWISLSVDELLAEARSYVESGLWGVKVKIGSPEPQVDMERLRRVREVIPTSMRLLVDANQCYDPLTAIRVGRRLADLDVHWFEEPVLADSVHDQARVAQALEIAVAAGENEYSRFGFRELIEHQAADILQPDVHRVGGVTEFMRIAALADAWNLPLAPHTSHQLHVHLVAATQTRLVLEYYPWLPDELFQHPTRLVDGCCLVPEVAGVGVDFVPEVAREFALP